MYSCNRCSFIGDAENFLSKKNGSLCKTCEKCRILARRLDKKRSKSEHRKGWRKKYENTEERINKIRRAARLYYGKNKEMVLERNKIYHEQISDKRKEYLSNWRRENKEKMREYYHKRKSLLLNSPGNNLTSKQIKDLYESHPYCEYCNCKEGLSIDHIVPLFRGGSNSIDNATIACKSCNSSKGTKLLEEWDNVS